MVTRVVPPGRRRAEEHEAMTDLEHDTPSADLTRISQLVAEAGADPHSAALSEAAQELGQLLMPYRFGLEEMLTKINILREELSFRPDGSPIEHVSSRVKSIDSLRMKAARLGCEFTPEAIAHQIFDIAGIRIVCSFLEDAYWVLSMLTNQPDVKVVEIKDYIAHPKPNGYRSLHAIVQVPVFLSDSIRDVSVELQVRTVAMDFWASVEHKIYYRFREEIPLQLGDELAEAASVAHELDQRMSDLRQSVRDVVAATKPDGA
jgi:putative GTP pyrophosphokinase